MTPLRVTFQKLSRQVRDLARQSGKEIDLELAGDDTELDRKVIEAIQDPLMHMTGRTVPWNPVEPAEPVVLPVLSVVLAGVESPVLPSIVDRNWVNSSVVS